MQSQLNRHTQTHTKNEIKSKAFEREEISCFRLINAIDCFSLSLSRSANYKFTHLALMDYYFKTKHTHTYTWHIIWLSNYQMVCNLTLEFHTQLIYHLVGYFA